jgi:hypothetical protein
MPKRVILALLAALLLLGAAGLAWAQVSPSYDLSWHVLSSGGREWAASTQYAVNGTLSQFAIGPATGTQFGVGSGYWYGIGGPVPTYLYLPIIYKNDQP